MKIKKLFISLILGLGLSLGLVGGDPVYMGGFAIVILIIALIPLQRIHALLLLLISLLLFTLIGSARGMEFVLTDESYGLANLVISIVVALMAIIVFDKIREANYKNRRLLKNTNAELQKLNELKNQLLQVVAHDLKDPLQVIIGYTDLLKTNLQQNKFARERLKIIHRSTERMIKLIGGLLQITSLESGNLPVHKSEVNFGEVVDASVKHFLKDAQQKNQHLQATIEKNCLVAGDQMLLRQVANHLISNALKFSSPGKTIYVNVDQQGDRVILTVRDEGPGLQEEEIHRLYDKFSRLSPKPTAGEISIGLGLAITRDLVELHQGTISVESQPGQGSTFTVHLPRLKKEV